MKKIFIALACLGLLSACGDDGGNGAGGAGYTHNDLAKEFARQLNLDSEDYFELVKSDTEQYNYIVIYDTEADSYNAVNLGGYIPGQTDPVQFLADNTNYIDLDVIPGYYESYTSWDTFCECYTEDTRYVETRYRDRRADITFEKTAPTPKDRLTLAALEESVQVKKAASLLSAKFGMSQERSFEVAELAVIWKNAPQDRMTEADHDEFATSILGHSISEYKAAVEKQMSGDSSDLNELIADTAQYNGLSPEKANQIVNNVFGVDVN